MDLAALVSDYTFQIVALGVAIFSFVAGGLGSFAVLRKQSLLGDAISHAALPGITLAFLLTLSKHPLVLLLGAAIAGWIGTLVISVITSYTKLKKDAAMGIVLSVFFGIGIMLLTLIQKMPLASQAGLESFLFGSASTLLRRDVHTMIALSVIVIVLLYLFWKEFKIITFDPDYAATLGLPTRRLDILLVTLIVVAIVIGLQTVGVVLMSALIIAPAAAARQWTNNLGRMVILAAVFGTLGGVLGVTASSLKTNLSTGPAVVVVISAIFIVSLLFAKNRGIVWDKVQHLANRKQVRITTSLLTLLRLADNHKDPHHAHTVTSLKAINPYGVEKAMHLLASEGWVTKKRKDSQTAWALTTEGVKEAKKRLRSLGDAPW